MEEVPVAIGCKLARHPEAWSGGRRRVNLLVHLLFVLKTLENPSCVALQELSVFISLQGKDPTSLDKVPGRMFSHVDEIIDIVLHP